VPHFCPTQLAAWTAGRWTEEPTDALTGFGIDTRRLRSGEVFVALKTENRDGHDFLAAAFAAGASAALVQTYRAECELPQLVVSDTLIAFQVIAREHRRTFKGSVTGISGSAGKTSTKDLLARLLGPGTMATEGNLNNHLGVPLTLTRLDSAQHTFAVVEAGISAPGEMDVLVGMIEPDVAVITLVAHAHTKELGGLAGVAREKAVLPANVRSSGVSIFPKSVASLAAFQGLPSRRLVVERADVLVPEKTDDDTIFFTVTHRGDETAIVVAYGESTPEVYSFRRVSDGITQNAVLAICVARWLGVAPSEIRERLIGWGPAPLRGEVRQDQGRLVYVDCYNANPASMVDALEAFEELTVNSAGRLFLLGGMEELGDVCDDKHRELGQSLRLQPADRLLLVGTGAEFVRFGALDAGGKDEQIELLGSLEGVSQRMLDWRGPVFIKGSRRYRLETLLGKVQGGSH
jgi:UDP-N-acetylmuramoyl-tripeptide--D-alanyl-D-alanine ligase